jgi:hypothetical protein
LQKATSHHPRRFRLPQEIGNSVRYISAEFALDQGVRPVSAYQFSDMKPLGCRCGIEEFGMNKYTLKCYPIVAAMVVAMSLLVGSSGLAYAKPMSCAQVAGLLYQMWSRQKYYAYYPKDQVAARYWRSVSYLRHYYEANCAKFAQQAERQQEAAELMQALLGTSVGTYSSNPYVPGSGSRGYGHGPSRFSRVVPSRPAPSRAVQPRRYY